MPLSRRSTVTITLPPRMELLSVAEVGVTDDGHVDLVDVRVGQADPAVGRQLGEVGQPHRDISTPLSECGWYRHSASRMNGM